MSNKKRFRVCVTNVSFVEIEADTWQQARDQVQENINHQDDGTMREIAAVQDGWDVCHVEHL